MAESLVFDPYGPFEIPCAKLRVGRIVDRTRLGEFWGDEVDYKALAEDRGVYVFSISRSGGGFLPCYVGKAVKQSFRDECFAPHKLTKYNEALLSWRGTPHLSLIGHRVGAGRVNGAAIHELETEIIQYAYAVNPGLLNVRGIKFAEWSVSGLIRHGRGKPPEDAEHLRRMLDID